MVACGGDWEGEAAFHFFHFSFRAVLLHRGECQTTPPTFPACPFKSDFCLGGSNHQSCSQMPEQWVPVSLGSLRRPSCPRLRQRDGGWAGRRGEASDLPTCFGFAREESTAVSEGGVTAKAHRTDWQSWLSSNDAILISPHPFIYFLSQKLFFSIFIYAGLFFKWEQFLYPSCKKRQCQEKWGFGEEKLAIAKEGRRRLWNLS